jgi:hypothetical protein
MINRANGRFQEEQYYPSRGAHLDIRPRGSRNGARGDRPRYHQLHRRERRWACDRHRNFQGHQLWPCGHTGYLRPTVGVHGFHIHDKGACGLAEHEGKMAAGFAAGGHYDPEHTGST